LFNAPIDSDFARQTFANAVTTRSACSPAWLDAAVTAHNSNAIPIRRNVIALPSDRTLLGTRPAGRRSSGKLLIKRLV
jgi:hypothetical protein